MASYFTGLFQLLGHTLPPLLTGFTFLGVENCSLLAVVLLAVLTAIFCFGMNESKIFNLVLTILKLVTLAFIIVVAFANVKKTNLSPFVL
jgi:amino acid transporter